MKEKMNQMFKDKLFLVMLVLGLLTIVAAAGIVTMQKGSGQEENPYVDMQGQGEFLAEDPAVPEPTAGESNAQAAAEQETKEEIARAGIPANPDTVVTESSHAAEARIAEEVQEAQEAGSGLDAARALVLDFADTSKLVWPIRGNIVLDYNMESTIYFPTLDQYKCNPGLVIQGEISDPVYAPANARVLETGSNEEIGNYLKLDLGNGYSAVCGQLKDVAAVAGEYLEQGQLLGYVAEPTKYYSVEGSNVFFQLEHEGKTVDPLAYME